MDVNEVAPSMPEPAPRLGGEPVTPALVAWLIDHAAAQSVVDAVLARDAFGREKYGQPLMTDDGRDVVEDARQELADALQYIMRARLTHADITALGPLIRWVAALYYDTVTTGCAP